MAVQGAHTRAVAKKIAAVKVINDLSKVILAPLHRLTGVRVAFLQ